MWVGNLVVVGAGKTPVAMALGAFPAARGARSHVVTRGYRGRLAGPVPTDPVTGRCCPRCSRPCAGSAPR
jgi:tetraacyldisaccharide-1-P 4'-kinase